MNKILRRTLKILGWTVGSIVLLLLLVVVLVQVPGVQQFLKGKAVAYLEHKLGTTVRIGHLSIAFPKKIVLEDVYFEDQKKDTLISGQRLAIDIAMFKLLKSRIEINDIELAGIRAKIYRTGTDTAFNYDYIVKAFTTPSTTPKPADTSGIDLSIDHIALSKVTASFRDDQSGSDMFVSIGVFDTKIDTFDINHFIFAVPSVQLEGVVARMYQHKPLMEPKTVAQVQAANTTAPAMRLSLGKVSLKNIDAAYGNDVSAMSAKVNLGELTVVPQKLDLEHLQIALKSIVLNNTTASIILGKTADAREVAEQVATTAQAQVANPWRITLANAQLSGNNLKFDNNNIPRTPKGMDYAHLNVQGLIMNAANLILTPSLDAGSITAMSVKEGNSHFVLKEARTEFAYDDHGIQLRNMYVQTDKSLLRDSIQIGWTSLDKLATQPGEMLIRANLPNCRIAFSDVLTFAPFLATLPPFAHNENAIFDVNARLAGYVKDLDIPIFEASGLSTTALSISGHIKGLPDAARTVYDINIARFRTSAGDIARLAPPGSIPNTIRIPEGIGASGYFRGSMAAFTTKLGIRTTRGNADILATMRGTVTYNVTAGIGALDLGYILKQEKTVGRIAGKVIANGSGFDPKTMVANVQASVMSAGVMGYNYRNIALNAKLNHGAMTANATARDPNISLNLDANALLKGAYPALQMNAQIDSINVGALGFYKGDLRIHGHIAADFPSTNPDALVGTANISDLIVYNAGKRYAAQDTISIAAASESGTNGLTVASQIITANLSGQYKLTEIGTAVMHTLNRYYTMPGFKETAFTPQQWTLNATLHPSPLLFTFMPELKGTDSIKANVAYNSSAEDLKLTAAAPKIVYGGNVVDSLNIRAATGDKLTYAVTLQDAGSAQFRLNHTALTGEVANNQVSTALDIKDPLDKSRYQLAAIVAQTPNSGFRASLQPGLMLDYSRWEVGTDNFIQYDASGVIVHNFSMSNGAQSLAANSTTDAASAPIDVRFTNFQIGTLTKIAEQNSLLVDGLINGTAQVRNPTTNLVFTSDLGITNLSYMRDTVGDLTVKVNNETEQTLAADVRLMGHGNNIGLTGRYFLADSRLDMKLNLTNVALATIKPFAAGQLLDAGGALRGQFAVTGTTAKPSVNGSMRFDSAFITPTMLGERFSMTNDAIDVNATGIHFNKFSIADSANNTANIDGDLLTSDFKNYKFALNITADNFRAVNSKHGSTHQPFYGKLNFSTKTKIGGDMNMPKVNSYVRINGPTDFSYVLPANDPEVQSRIGVVEFVDMSAPKDSNVFKKIAKDSATLPVVTGMDVSATIETDTAANFAIVIDERNGDAIHIRGAAALEADVDPRGKISLTGAYTMQEGSYLLTLNFLKRQFYIKAGSTITWEGDPMQANVDITAIYTANTAPIDLVEHQLSGRSDYEVNQYKLRVPFNVLLQMRGQLMKPQITFDIQLPEREADRLKDVDAKLAQVRADESELNKQVFALLLLGHFVDENPLESNGTPNTAESFVRQSASRILTDQLNRLAGNLIHGVDLTFGVNSGSDYSTGELTQKTDLSVGLSKRLLNDRLKVNVGSSFGIEGPTAPNQQASNIAGDVSVDYQLTKSGHYLLRAYRRNNYEGLAEGQVIESGATLIYRLEYDRLRELWRRTGRKKDAQPKTN